MAISNDVRLLEACLRINNLRELEAFKQHLGEEYAKLTEAIVSCDNERLLAVMQGKAQQLRGLINLIETSSEELDRLKSRNPAAFRSTLG